MVDLTRENEMSKSWTKATLILDDGTQKTGWVDMQRVILVAPHNDGSMLEFGPQFAYRCVEPPSYFMPNGGGE